MRRLLSLLCTLIALPLLAQSPKASRAQWLPQQKTPPIMLAQLQQMYLNNQMPPVAGCGAVNTSGLIAWWPLDSASGGNMISPTPEVIGGQSLPVLEGVIQVQIGVISNSANINQHHSQAWFEAAGSLINGSAARTTCLWFNCSVTGDVEEIFGYGRGGSNQRWGMAFDSTVTPALFAIECNGAITEFQHTQDSLWHFWAATYTGGAFVSGTNPIQYLDGVAQTVANFVAGTPNTTAQDIAIGEVPSAGADFYNGFVDDVRVYNRALSPAEILAIYQNGTHGTLGTGTGCP